MGYDRDSLLEQNCYTKHNPLLTNEMNLEQGSTSGDGNGVFRKIATQGNGHCTRNSAKVRNIKRIIRKHLGILLQDPLVTDVLEEEPSFVFRKCRNLAFWISNNKNWLKSKGTYKCGCRRYKECSAIQISKDFASTYTKKQCKVPQYFNCLSRGWGPILYVGQTIHAVGVRILEHLFAVDRGDEKLLIARHVKLDHVDPVNIRFQVIDHLQGSYTCTEIRKGHVNKRLLAKEVYWIYHLKTTEVYGGMNRDWELSCYF
ncbi:hypothetical protein XELAEV_18037377mg [Xenopus laevis]|uniref:Uncharacterized protein n=1 Tax=Xenopus laevis TaxID=8355 RepID=A0A974HAK8_XENLA|nr:hypothetical protein XELAEV_18037377mg [Xenopus laevis]